MRKIGQAFLGIIIFLIALGIFSETRPQQAPQSQGTIINDQSLAVRPPQSNPETRQLADIATQPPPESLQDTQTIESTEASDTITEETPAEDSSGKADKREITVYITRTGSKYHLGSCRYLSRSKIPVNLSDAKGSYGPCSVCNPPS